MIVKIKMDGKAVIPSDMGVANAGYDLVCPEDTLIHYGRQKIDTGVHLEFPCNIAAFVRARSGMSLKGLEVYSLNDEEFKYPLRIDADVLTGLIDSNYRGSIGIIVKSYEHNYYRIKAGTRLAQLVFEYVEKPDFVVCDELSDTERADGGFGHSGTN